MFFELCKNGYENQFLDLVEQFSLIVYFFMCIFELDLHVDSIVKIRP